MSTPTPPLGISYPALIAAVAAEIASCPLGPNEERYVVLVDDDGGETDIPIGEFHRRLLAGERFDGYEIFVTCASYWVDR